jgi:type I restriction enzyme M protein
VVSGEVSYLTLTEVAERTGVRLSAVSNWRTRHSDFPKPQVVSGQEVFELSEVATWLKERKVPRNRLKPGEPEDTSYGDRFLLKVGTAGSSGPVSTHESRRRESAWTAQLRTAVDRLRGTHDTASSLEFVLGLVFVKRCRTEVWQSIVGASTWSEMHDVLVGISLSVGTDTSPVPLFGKVSRSVDPTMTEVVHLIDKIDFGRGEGPRSTAAQISEAILADLERRMGRSGGRFTPPDVAGCLVELLDPQQSDRIYDPFCGSGELLSAAAAYVGRQGGSPTSWQVYGQTPHEWSWLTSKMNLALHGVNADLRAPGNALQEDRFPGLRFSRILANPPFNLHMDPLRNRIWPFGEPPAHNANFAWLQHVVTKLEAGGRAAVVMPNGAASVRGEGELAIRRAMIEAGTVECVIALPPQLFRFTGIPTMVWILRGVRATPALREILLIDARDLGDMIDRTKRRLGADDIERIVNEYQRWRNSPEPGKFTRTDGFSRAVGHHEISENDCDLTPGRYTGLATRRPDTAQVIAELGALRDEFDELSKRAEEVRVGLSARLAALIAGHRPSSDGQFVPLGTVCDVLPGPGTVSRSGRQPGWTPLVLPRNINNNRIGFEHLDVVPPATAQRMARYRLIAGDIVTARAGTLGRYGQVLEEQAGWLLGPGCVRFRPNDEADPDYLTFYLGSPVARDWLMAHATGSAIQQVNRAILLEMTIWLPSLSVQRAIAEILRPFHTAASLHDRTSGTAKKLHDVLVPMLMSPILTPEVE